MHLQGWPLMEEICAHTRACSVVISPLSSQWMQDWLLMEEEFVQNQERLKPADERNEEERTKVGRGSRALLPLGGCSALLCAWRLQRAAGS